MLVEYTSAASVKSNVLAAIDQGVGVVVGSSGLSAEDYSEIDEKARTAGSGGDRRWQLLLAAALQLRFAEEAARQLDAWEIVDYASATKPDAPSGTARELAERLEGVRAPAIAVPLAEVLGPEGCAGRFGRRVPRCTRLRLPSFIISTDIVFGAESERLSLRYDAGESAAPYIAGTLLAIRALPIGSASLGASTGSSSRLRI